MAHVLVVDDDVQLGTMLQKMLIRAGYEVTYAVNGHIAMKIIRTRPTNVVITDIVMPDKDGLETIQEIKRDFPEVKIIAISGGGRIGPKDYLSMAVKFGAQFAFVKPIERDTLMNALHELTN